MFSRTAETQLPQRLLKRAAESLRLPLQNAAKLWHAGRLSVITADCAEPRILPLDTSLFEEDQMLLDGKPIDSLAPVPVHALLNKPKYVTCTARDPRGKSDLSRYLYAMPAGCFPVGRLDRETTGLLLFTNDGDLASAVLRPDHVTIKRYWLWLDEDLSDDDPRLAALVTGVLHNGAWLSARSAHILERGAHGTEVELTLTQGRKRQIRHLCFALGLRLFHLHRRAIGPLHDAGLRVGDWRLLADAEVNALWDATGGRAELRQRKIRALMGHAASARKAGTPQARLEEWLARERARCSDESLRRAP